MATWTKSQQSWDGGEDGIIEKAVGIFEQIPLVIAYAVTIHKCQGLTLDDVRIDLGRGAFAPGQLYVALRRARSLDGLSFTRDLTVSDVRVDPMLLSFVGWARQASNLSFGPAGTS